MVTSGINHFSSEFQGYRTPPEWLERIRAVGPIALDPATTVENPTGAERFFTPSDDGLTQDWKTAANGGLWFVNPEYGDALDIFWSKKIAEEGMKKPPGGGIALVPARCDTVWFRRFTTADALCFVKGRIKFIGFNPLTQQWERGAWSKRSQKWMPNSPAGFPSLFAYWGPRPDRFREVFGPFGWIPV